MTGPDRPELRGKPDPAENPDPDFQIGLQAGRVAAEPSRAMVSRLIVAEALSTSSVLGEIRKEYPKTPDYSRRTEYQDRMERYGYIAGLEQFMAEHGFPTGEPLAFISPGMLISPHAFSRYIIGLRRELPMPEIKKEKDDFSFEPRRDRDYDSGFGSAYLLGFGVSIARDYGITPGWGEVPADYSSYTAFDQGRRGETRLMSLSTVVGEKISLLEFDLRRQEDAYVLGLKTWLKDQGIEGVEVSQIRPPKALEAFIAGLDGKNLLHPDVIAILGTLEAPVISRTPNLRKKREWDDDIYGEKYEEKIYSFPRHPKDRFDDLTEISNAPHQDRLRNDQLPQQAYQDQAALQAFTAFILGKKAGTERLAREKAASEQQTSSQ